MKNNVGSTDKIIRIILAVTFSILYFTNVISGSVGIVLMALSVIFLLTSLISFCPIYSIFGLSSAKKENTNK